MSAEEQEVGKGRDHPGRKLCHEPNMSNRLRMALVVPIAVMYGLNIGEGADAASIVVGAGRG